MEHGGDATRTAVDSGARPMRRAGRAVRLAGADALARVSPEPGFLESQAHSAAASPLCAELHTVPILF